MTAVLLHTLAHTVSILQSFILFHTLSIHIHIFHKSCFNLHLVERERAIYPFYTPHRIFALRLCSIKYSSNPHKTSLNPVCLHLLRSPHLPVTGAPEMHWNTHTLPAELKVFYGALFSIWFHRLITLFCWYVLRLFRQTNNAHHLSDN